MTTYALIPPRRIRKGHRHGRATIPDRAVLTGILYVLVITEKRVNLNGSRRPAVGRRGVVRR